MKLLSLIKKNSNLLANVSAFLILLFFVVIVVVEAAFLSVKGFRPSGVTFSNLNYLYLSRFRPFFNQTSNPDGSRTFYSSTPHCPFPDFVMPKPENTLRVFIVGTSLSLHLSESLLRALDNLGNADVEVINCSMAAFNVERIRGVFEEIIDLSPDLIVVVSTLRYDDAPLGFDVHPYYINALLRRFHTYCFFQDRFKEFFNCKEKKLQQEDLYKFFENNLRFMAKTAQERKTPLVLCSIPWNLRDCPPRSENHILDSGVFYWRGELELQKGNTKKALSLFRKFVRESSDNALGYYKMGKIFYGQGEFELARENFVEALNREKRSKRTKPRANAIIREIAGDYGPTVMLADLEKEISGISQGACPGLNIFYDFTHWFPFVNEFVCYVVSKSLFRNSAYLPRIVAPEASCPVMDTLDDDIPVLDMFNRFFFAMLATDVRIRPEMIFNYSAYLDSFAPGCMENDMNDIDTFWQKYKQSLSYTDKVSMEFKKNFYIGEFFRRRNRFSDAEKYFNKVKDSEIKDGREVFYFFVALNHLGKGDRDGFLFWLDKANRAKLRLRSNGIKDIEQIKMFKE